MKKISRRNLGAAAFAGALAAPSIANAQTRRWVLEQIGPHVV